MKHPHLWISPHHAFGSPAIRGTGIRTATVYGRVRDGETIGAVAADYDVPPLVVEVCIAFELGRSRSKAAREALEP